MSTYLFQFSYTSESWAAMIAQPGDRTVVVRRVVESLGGSLEGMYWMLGSYDGIAIARMPDSVTGAALHVLVSGSGAFTSVHTCELLHYEQLARALELASGAAPSFQRPGQA